jgi:hypothetical protein
VPNQNPARPRKAYMVSLRHKITQYYRREQAEQSSPDRRWLNGFMAAGFHSGLITLKELKLESLSSYRDAHGRRMTEAEELYLERRLTKLCEQK